MRLFEEVQSNHTDSFTGERSIDGWFPGEDDETGVTVAWVKPDGTFRLGDHAKPEYLFCDSVQVALRDTIVEVVTKQQQAVKS